MFDLMSVGGMKGWHRDATSQSGDWFQYFENQFLRSWRSVKICRETWGGMKRSDHNGFLWKKNVWLRITSVISICSIWCPECTRLQDFKSIKNSEPWPPRKSCLVATLLGSVLRASNWHFPLLSVNFTSTWWHPWIDRTACSDLANVLNPKKKNIYPDQQFYLFFFLKMVVFKSRPI